MSDDTTMLWIFDNNTQTLIEKGEYSTDLETLSAKIGTVVDFRLSPESNTITKGELVSVVESPKERQPGLDVFLKVGNG